MKFTLKVKCYKDKSGKIINDEIFSKDLIFVPQGEQEKNFLIKKQKNFHFD